MAVVTAAQLRRFMSNPQWSAEQTEVAEELCVDLEVGLADALGGTFITPVAIAETAPVLIGSGQVDTRYPVSMVLAIGGVAVDEGDPPPDGFVVRDYRLYRLAELTGLTATTGSPFVAVSELPSWGAAWMGQSAGWISGAGPSEHGVGAVYSGAVAVEYMAGWGAHPSLVNAILRKAAAFMENRHSDVAVAVGLDAQAPPKPTPEEWTDIELARLGRFRRLGIGGR
jgi:hypothetical protein